MSAVLELPQTTSLKAIGAAVDFARRHEASVILSGIKWETYERFVQKTLDKLRSPRFYYEKGNLLIMPPTAEHESNNRSLASVVEVIAEICEMDWCNFGSTTFRREDMGRGFAPDTCFYFQNVAQMRGVRRLDMSVHPAPELIIEIDITSLSTMRQSIYAAFGVAEIWRYNGVQVEILTLSEGRYAPCANSLALPLVTPAKLTEFLQLSQSLSRLEWLRQVRAWAQEAQITQQAG